MCAPNPSSVVGIRHYRLFLHGDGGCHLTVEYLGGSPIGPISTDEYQNLTIDEAAEVLFADASWSSWRQLELPFP